MKKIIYTLLIIVTLLSIASCSLDDVMTNMGSNVMGKVFYDKVEVEIVEQNMDDLKDTTLGKILNSIIPEDVKVDSIVAPIDSSTKEKLVQNSKSPKGQDVLEEMKDAPANPTEQEQKAIKGTASIVDSYLKKVPTTPNGDVNTGNAEVDKLVTSMKKSFDELVKNPKSATQGDVIGLQCTVDLLNSVANAIDEPITITVINPETNEEQQRTVSSEALLNTLFQNKEESNPDHAPLTSAEIKALMDEPDGNGAKAVSGLIQSAQDYVKVVGSATNFFGDETVDVDKLLSSFLGSNKDQKNGGTAQ